MPAPVKFSEKFYRTFGHDIVDELADWLGNMDLTYRTELRDLNDRNVARFESVLGRRIGEVRTEFRQEIGKARAELQREIGELRSEMKAGFAELESRLGMRLIRWMFLFWTGTTVTMLGVLLAILRIG